MRTCTKIKRILSFFPLKWDCDVPYKFSLTCYTDEKQKPVVSDPMEDICDYNPGDSIISLKINFVILMSGWVVSE